jgi:hypothetical protein
MKLTNYLLYVWLDIEIIFTNTKYQPKNDDGIILLINLKHF